MRVKIKHADVGGYLQFGKKYAIDVYGASFWFEFIFTRKKRQFLTCVGSNGTKDTVEISTRKLKQFINNKRIVRFVIELQ